MKVTMVGTAGIMIVVGLFASVASAQINYQSVEGGSEENMLLWENTSTWDEGVVPEEGEEEGYFTIVDNSYVTMYSTTYNNRYRNANADCFVWGSLYLGTSVTEPELEINSINATDSAGKTGTFTLQDTDVTIHSELGGSGTLNVYATESDLIMGASGIIGNGTNISLYPSGRLLTPSLGGTINLNGGTLMYTPTDSSTLVTNMHIGDWDPTGRVTVCASFRTNDTTLADKFSASEGTELVISGTEGQVATLSLCNESETGQNWEFNDGTITLEARDEISFGSCDSIIVESALDSISVGSDTILTLNGNYGGIDDPQDLVGNIYKLFDVESNDYSGITPYIADTTAWSFDGIGYNVTFINDLATNGTLTIASITPVPEPVTAGLLIMGGIALLKRRKR